MVFAPLKLVFDWKVSEFMIFIVATAANWVELAKSSWNAWTWIFRDIA